MKEHIDSEVEIEDGAFDRYVSNVGLLEETFSVESLKEKTPSEDRFKDSVNGIKIRFQSSIERSNSIRDRVRKCIEDGLEDLKRFEVTGSDNESSEEFKRERKLLRSKVERTAAVEDLIDKLIKARSEDDLKASHETKMQIYKHDSGRVMESKDRSIRLTSHTIDGEQLLSIQKEFDSIGQMAEL